MIEGRYQMSESDIAAVSVAAHMRTVAAQHHESLIRGLLYGMVSKDHEDLPIDSVFELEINSDGILTGVVNYKAPEKEE